MMSRKTSEKDVRKVSVLGSTGSIGCSTLDIILRNPSLYRVEVLTAHKSVELLANQARRTQARLAVIGDKEKYAELKELLSGTETKVSAGRQALVEAAQYPVEWTMAAIVGAAGLEPTLAAVKQGSVVALANKECLVCAGKFFLDEVAKSGTTLLPVDSEHNAIFQVLDIEQRDTVKKLILTASGGPFWNTSIDSLRLVTPERAVAHPNWNMGAKISVDSATMMNKGLELIEAHYLFDMNEDMIDIVIHPESIIHSLVSYIDGSVLAQLGSPDMRTPIAYALGWPNRILSPSPTLNLAELGKLTFFEPDNRRFPLINLAREAIRVGGNASVIINASNEVAVKSFLDRRNCFLDIFKIVSRTLDKIKTRKIKCLEDVFAADEEARHVALDVAKLCEEG